MTNIGHPDPSHPNPVLNATLLYSPVIVGLLMMLPRLATPQFGLFDDGQTITNALQVFQGHWGVIFENAYGRTRPIYWLFYTLIFGLAGRDPFWYFLVNLVVFLITIIALMGLVRSLGGSSWQAWIAGLLFTVSGPVIENIYTLSKAEMIQMALMLIGLLFFARLTKQADPFKNLGSMIAIASITLIATLIKEVTLIGAAIAVGWLAALGVVKQIAKRTTEPAATNPRPRLGSFTKALWVYLASQGFAALIFLVIRGVSSGTMVIQKTTTSYAANFDLAFSKLAANFVHWSGWILHDFPYLFLTILVLIFWILARKKLPQPALLAGAAIWMAAWFIFYMPWRFIVDYYLLPFAIGSSIVCGVILGEVIDSLIKNSARYRLLGWASLVITLVLFVVTLVNDFTNARIQLNVDDANTAMLNFIATSAPESSQVLLNLSPQSEYGSEITMQLGLVQLRPDLQVTFLSPKSLAAAQASGLPYLIVSPELINQLILSVRMGVSEPDVSQANAILASEISAIPVIPTTFTRQFHLVSIDLSRLVCAVRPLSSFCSKNNSIFDHRLFTYGWTIYQAKLP